MKLLAKSASVLTMTVALVGLGSLAPAAAATTDRGASVAGDPSQWLTRKVNEYEGQHR